MKSAASKTARKAALNIVSLGAVREMEGVLPCGAAEATARLLTESEVASRRAVQFSRTQTAVLIYRAFDWMTPGQFEAFAYRKAFCEGQVRDGINAGAGQVLVLGAGYDTLAWRLAPEFPNVGFLEIDHPATADVKAKGIESMGQAHNHHLIAKDLGECQLKDVLIESKAWDAKVQSIIIAEGLLMYLPPDAVGTLFKQCAAVSGAGSRIAFSYIGVRDNGQLDAGPWSWMVMWMLRGSGEPWLWGIKPVQLGTFLGQNNWTFAPDLSPLTGKHGLEYFATAER